MRVVFDTNVFVSTVIKPDSLPAFAFSLTRYDGARLLVSNAIFIELQRVLLEKLNIDPKKAMSFLDMLAKRAESVSPRHALNVVHADPSDDRILECAIEGKANAIVSGDRHLLDLKKFRRIPIITVREFIDIIHR